MFCMYTSSTHGWTWGDDESYFDGPEFVQRLSQPPPGSDAGFTEWCRVVARLPGLAMFSKDPPGLSRLFNYDEEG